MKLFRTLQILFLAGSILFAGNVQAQSNEAKPDNDYAKALEIYYNGEYQLAIPVFTSALEQVPVNYEAYIYRGNCYSFLHQ